MTDVNRRPTASPVIARAAAFSQQMRPCRSRMYAGTLTSSSAGGTNGANVAGIGGRSTSGAADMPRRYTEAGGSRRADGMTPRGESPRWDDPERRGGGDAAEVVLFAFLVAWVAFSAFAA